MDLRLFVCILLLGRLVTFYFIGPVVWAQLKLLHEVPLKKTSDPFEREARKRTISMLLTSLVASIIPAVMDVMTLRGIDLGRPATVPIILVIYSFTYNFSSILMAAYVKAMKKLSDSKITQKEK